MNVRPRWIGELIRLLDQDTFYLSNGHIPTLVAAVQDIQGWLDDSREYLPFHHDQGWRSSRSDFKAAFETLGPELQTAVRAQASTLLVLGDLPFDEEQKSNAKNEVAALLARLGGDEVSTAAWHDLVAGSKAIRLKSQLLKLRRDNLWDIARFRHRDVGTFGLGWLLREALNNREIDILTLQARLGDRDYPDFQKVDCEKRSSLSTQGQLELCERLINHPVDPTHNVVWLNIRNASLHRPKLDLDAVMFFQSEWLCGVLQDEKPNRNRDGLPPELIGEGTTPETFKYDFRSDPHLVIARVDVGVGPPNEAVTKARSTLEATISYVLPDHKNWQILNGYVAFQDGKRGGSSLAAPPDVRDAYSPNFDQTSRQLEEKPEDIKSIATVSTSDVNISEALKYRRQLNESHDADPLVKIIIAVRIIEITNSWATAGRSDWYIYATNYFSANWRRLQLIDRLDSVTQNAIHSRLEFDTESNEKLQSIQSDVTEPSSMAGFRFHRDKAIAHLDELVAIYKGTYRERELNELRDCFRSGGAVYAQFVALEREFDMLMERLRRYRNAGQHGGPTTERAYSGLATFALRLAHMALIRAIESYFTGDSYQHYLQSIKAEHESRFARLKGGAPVTDMFF